MVYGFNVGNARGPYAWARAALCASLLLSMGCTPGGVTNVITGMSITGRSQRPNSSCDSGPAGRGNCTPELLESLQFAKLGADDISVAVQGTGRCSGFTIDFGDGFSNNAPGVQLGSNPVQLQLAHKYVNWPGKKQVRVRGAGCLGEFTKELSVGLDADGHEEFRLGVVPNASVCNFVTHTSGVNPILRPGAVVRVEASGRIRYGVMEHDASGDRTIGAPTGYAFPMHRPYSLIYRVRPLAGQGAPLEIQGENGPVIFTNTNRGLFEVCVNDHPSHLTDNIGSMFLQISVNESRATGQ
jgi:hypothetical protein